MGKPRRYIAFATSKVVHLNNPETGRSYCQFENNWARATNKAGMMPPYKFSRRDRYPEAARPDCKNCVALAPLPAHEIERTARHALRLARGEGK